MYCCLTFLGVTFFGFLGRATIDSLEGLLLESSWEVSTSWPCARLSSMYVFGLSTEDSSSSPDSLGEVVVGGGNFLLGGFF